MIADKIIAVPMVGKASTSSKRSLSPFFPGIGVITYYGGNFAAVKNLEDLVRVPF